MATGPVRKSEKPEGGLIVSIDTLNLLACEGDKWAAKEYDFCVYGAPAMLAGVRLKDGHVLSYVVAE